MDDVALLERARKGDDDAFAQLFARFQGPIYRYAAHMCGRDSGDDIVQDTFLALLRQNGRFDPGRGTVVGYLFGIARHLVLDRLAAREPYAAALDDEAHAAAEACASTPLDGLTRGETVAAVRAAVRSLPPAYREVVVLCDLQEMDYADAAGIIRCPIGTVRSRLHRARTMLSAKLAAMPATACPERSRGAGAYRG